MSVRGEGQPSRAAVTTLSDGRFVISQLCEGAVEVRASFRTGTGAPGVGPGTIQARAGDQNVVLRLQKE